MTTGNSRKGLKIAARIVFGILAAASLVAAIYYIVKGSLSETLTSLTLCLLSIALGIIYGREEKVPEGVISPEEKERVMSHLGGDAIIVDEGEWYFEGDVTHTVSVKDGVVTLTDGDKKYTISDITPDSFIMKDSSGTLRHARKR